MPRRTPRPRDEWKKLILDCLKYGIVRTTQQVATEIGSTWATAYVNLSELEREGRITCIPSGNRMSVWRLKK